MVEFFNNGRPEEPAIQISLLLRIYVAPIWPDRHSGKLSVHIREILCLQRNKNYNISIETLSRQSGDIFNFSFRKDKPKPKHIRLPFSGKFLFQENRNSLSIKRKFFSLSKIGDRGGLDRSFPEKGNHICFGSSLSLQTENKQWEF